MSKPNLLQQERELLRTFRQAIVRRTKAEYEADACRKAEREAADAALHQERQTAATQLAETQKAREQAQGALAQANLQHLLKQTRPTPPAARPDANPAQGLSRSVSVATEATAGVQAGIEALQRWRSGGRARLYRRLAVASVFVLSMIILTMKLWDVAGDRVGRVAPGGTAVVSAVSATKQQPMGTPQVLATITQEAKPTLTLTPTPTFTTTPVIPTATPRPSPTPTPIVVTGLFANLWQKFRTELGNPLPGNTSDRKFPAYTFSEMPFEGGHMFSSVPNKRIWVAFGSGSGAWTGSGTWREFSDKWREGDPEYSCAKEADYPKQPIWGFGLVWCNYPEVRKALGWGQGAIRDFDRESPGSSIYRLQEFERGFIFRDSDGWTNNLAYVFFNNGTFVRQSYR
jgi:hypothetical protein